MMKCVFIQRLFKWHSYERVLIKVLSPLISTKPIHNPKLMMTLLVRNEADIIETNLFFHRQMGVDGFIVTDNNSTDETANILRKYYEKGWIKEIINEPGNNYNQKKWVDRMIKIAKNKYHTDWIINADADELWYTPLGNLKKEIDYLTCNIVNCPLMNVMPEEKTPLSCWNKVVVSPIQDLEERGLSKYAIYNIQINKEMHRTKGYIRISDGNHFVEMFPEKRSYNSTIVIYHYPVRGYSHFQKKVVQGGEAINNNPAKNIGTHWKALYDIYLQGKLFEEYKKVVGDKNVVGQMLDEGSVKIDETVPLILKKILSKAKC